MLSGRRILLGVSGSIAAYKSAELIRALRAQGAEVQSALTANGERFISALTLETLAGRRAACSMFDRGQGPMPHIDLSRWAEALVVAPASANIMAKAATGLADDLLSTLMLSCPAPLIVCPAMNPKMWEHPATTANADTLARRGAVFVGPDSGPAACDDLGRGRLAPTENIVFAVRKALDARPPFLGLKVLVSSGPTRERIDPIRFLSNASSGRMGHALAAEAAVLGAEVILVSGPVAEPDPPGVAVVRVESAAEMFEAVKSNLDGVRLVIKAAAVADFRNATVAGNKRKKADGLALELEPTVDILDWLGRNKNQMILVGFAAETEDVRAGALDKLERKNLDAVAANLVGRPGSGMGAEMNAVELFFRDRDPVVLDLEHKRPLARRILQELEPLL